MRANLNYVLLAATASLAFAGAASAQSGKEQLAASAGIPRSAVEQLTLTEVAAYKFNRDESGADQQKVRIEPGRSNGAPAQLAGAAGISADERASLSLTEISAHFFNRGSSDDDHQTVHNNEGVTAGARQAAIGPSADVRQLAASAGLTEEEAQGMSLRQIAAHAFNQSESYQDRQRTDQR
jgi:hypothetical protein